MTQPAAGAVGNNDLLPALAWGHFPYPHSPGTMAGGSPLGEPDWQGKPSWKGCSAEPAVHSSVPVCPQKGLLP